MRHTVCRVNLVYIISAYGLPEQLVRLATRLRTEKATVLVHVDKKASPAVFGAISEAVRLACRTSNSSTGTSATGAASGTWPRRWRG